MRKKAIFTAAVIIAILTAGVMISRGKAPYKNLKAANIVSAAVYLSPPNKTVQITDAEIEELVSYLNEIGICKSFFSKVLKLLAFQGVWMFLYSQFPLFFPLSGKNKGKSYCTLSSSFAASRLASLLACA